MADPVVAPVETKVETPVLSQEVKPEVKTPEPDLMTRVTQFKKQESVKPPDENPFGLVKEDYDKVQSDPTLSKFYKSMLSDYTKKTQSVAEAKKEAEKIKAEFSNWSPEKVQQLLNDQKFVESARIVAEKQAPQNFKGSQEEWSALSDADKAKFSQMEQEINLLKQQNLSVLKAKEDETLKTRYSNYDPQKVDEITADLLANKVQATREHLYKAFFHDDNVRAAYELGKQDALKESTDKVQSVSFDGTNVTAKHDTPEKQQGESDRSFFRRLVIDNVNRQKK